MDSLISLQQSRLTKFHSDMNTVVNNLISVDNDFSRINRAKGPIVTRKDWDLFIQIHGESYINHSLFYLKK
jgi:hypothetical protein